MLALRLTEGLGSAALLGDIAQLYGNRDRLPPGLGLPRPDNHAALATPSDHAAKATTTFLAGSLAMRCRQERPLGPNDWGDMHGHQQERFGFCLWANQRRDSRTPKDVSAAVETGRVVGLATTLATATKGRHYDPYCTDGCQKLHLS
jgi:hypothetical protein